MLSFLGLTFTVTSDLQDDILQERSLSWTISKNLRTVLNIVGLPKGGMQAKGIWKQDPEANIWTQERWKWWVEKAPQWGTS